MDSWPPAAGLTPNSVNVLVDAPAIIRDPSVGVPLAIGVVNARESREDLRLEQIELDLPGRERAPLARARPSSFVAATQR